ncbi:MAG: hypothetical protein FJX29_15900 [Alphaproteobacteria bacterium]|nr:hypothetical protein [Alphaproteobacteria bacterium]
MDQYAFGRPIQYPAGRYEDAILIRAAAFAWRQDAPGFWKKALGVFSERQLSLDMLKLSSGAATALSSPGAMTLIYITSGNGVSGSGPLRDGTSIRLDAGEEISWQAQNDLQAVRITIPILPAA